MTEKADAELLHAKIWLEKYPGWWEQKGELTEDPDNLVAGTELLDYFAMEAVGQFHLRDGTHFRVSRSQKVMKDYIVRAGMAWTIAPLRPR